MSGSEPNRSYEAYKATLDSMSPARSLERLVATARFLMGSAAVVGGLVTAFGLAELDTHHATGWQVAALVLLTLALACAAFASVERAALVNLEDENAVMDFVDEQLRNRSRAVIASSVLFVLAIVVGGVAAATAIGDASQPFERDLSASVVTGKRATVSLQEHIVNADPVGTVLVRVSTGRRTLARGTYPVEPGGSAHWAMWLSTARSGPPIKVVSTLSIPGRKSKALRRLLPR